MSVIQSSRSLNDLRTANFSEGGVNMPASIYGQQLFGQEAQQQSSAKTHGSRFDQDVSRWNTAVRLGACSLSRPRAIAVPLFFFPDELQVRL